MLATSNKVMRIWILSQKGLVEGGERQTVKQVKKQMATGGKKCCEKQQLSGELESNCGSLFQVRLLGQSSLGSELRVEELEERTTSSEAEKAFISLRSKREVHVVGAR